MKIKLFKSEINDMHNCDRIMDFRLIYLSAMLCMPIGNWELLFDPVLLG